MIWIPHPRHLGGRLTPLCLLPRYMIDNCVISYAKAPSFPFYLPSEDGLKRNWYRTRSVFHEFGNLLRRYTNYRLVRVNNYATGMSYHRCIPFSFDCTIMFLIEIWISPKTLNLDDFEFQFEIFFHSTLFRGPVALENLPRVHLRQTKNSNTTNINKTKKKI